MNTEPIVQDSADNNEDQLLLHLQEVVELLQKQKIETRLFQKHPGHQPLEESVLVRQQQGRLRNKLARLHNADIAYILESLPLDQRRDVWLQVQHAEQGQILLQVSDTVRQSLISDMQAEQLVSTAGQLESDEIADLAPDLPKKVMQGILRSLNDRDRRNLQTVMAYPEDRIGALMDFGMITIRNDITLKAVSRYIRKLGSLPDHTDKLFVVDRDNRLQGVLSIEKLLTSRPECKVAEKMATDIVSFNANDDATEAARAFERYNLITAPVVDDRNLLQGRVSVDAMLDFIREEQDEDVLIQAGVDEEEDLAAGIWKSAKNRWTWLMINVVTAFVATRVIGMFEGTIMHLVALASLMPIVAAIGGNTGNQTSMLIIRSLALGQISPANVRRLIKKELSIGLLNGIVWGGIIGGLVGLLYQDLHLGGVMLGAMLLNLMVAAIAGISIPLLRHKLGKDPAVGTSVMITFITDAMGFLIFLGLATLFLL